MGQKFEFDENTSEAIAARVPLGPRKIYLYAKPADMRKSFDGLHAIVQSEFRRDIRAGDVFLFLNRRLDRVKLIHWDQDELASVKRRPRFAQDAARGAPQEQGCSS